jgi:hypothetical protein
MLRRRRVVATALLLPLFGCTCGETRESPADVKKIFDALFAALPDAKVSRPLDAIPDALDAVFTSADPEAWRSWAESQKPVAAMMKTPLFEDLRVSRTYLAIDGLSRKAALAASWTGGKDDKNLLWRGPTALGFQRDKSGTGFRFVLAKRVDPTMRGLVRFAAAFAMVAKAESKEGYGGKLLDLDRGGQKIAFVVFKDLVIAGNDHELVERARLLAMKDAKEKAATSGVLAKILPAEREPGIHGALHLEAGGFAELLGVEAFGFSLVPNANAPIVIRKKGKEAPDDAALSLLRYAPLSAFFAIADGGSPSANVFLEVKHRLERAGEGDGEEADDDQTAKTTARRGQKPLLAEADIENAIVPRLSTGIVFVAGAFSDPAEQASSLASFVALRHKGDMQGLEPHVRRMLEVMTKKSIERTVLEDMGGAILLAPASDGPAAAITEDALLFALAPERLRMALAAGRGKAPSLKDRSGVGLGEKANAGVFVDFEKLAKFLGAYYPAALASDAKAPWSTSGAALDPTFSALAGFGAVYGHLASRGDQAAEGALHVLP